MPMTPNEQNNLADLYLKSPFDERIKRSVAMFHSLIAAINLQSHAPPKVFNGHIALLMAHVRAYLFVNELDVDQWIQCSMMAEQIAETAHMMNQADEEPGESAVAAARKLLIDSMADRGERPA